MGRVINEIMSDHRKLLQRQKEYLLHKSKKYMFPQIIWIEAPYHDNFDNNALRKIYNKCLDKVASFNTDVTILDLRKIWESDNSRLFIEENSRFTSEGFATYWAAVDCTLKFMDTILIDKILSKTAKKDKKKKRKDKGKTAGKPAQSQSRYKWQSEAYKKSHKRPKRRENPIRKRLNYDDYSSDDYYIEDETRRELPRPMSYEDY